MHSNLDDVLEHYATPSAEYSSWSAQNNSVSNSSRKKADVRSRSAVSVNKKSSVSPLLATGSRSSVSHTHSFLGKYGVGTYLTPGSVSQQGDTSSTYWLKRLGMIETAATTDKACTRSNVARPKRSSSPAAAVAHRRSSSSRRISSAQKPHRSAVRVVDMAGTAAEKSPKRTAAGGARSPPGKGGREAAVHDAVDRAVAKLQADDARRAVVGEDLDSELMREVLLSQPERGEGPASDGGSNGEGLRMRSGACTPASAVSHPGFSQAASCSENGDSWSVASATSSFSILSGLNLDGGEERDRARGGAQGFGYATVLLMSDEEEAGAARVLRCSVGLACWSSESGHALRAHGWLLVAVVGCRAGWVGYTHAVLFIELGLRCHAEGLPPAARTAAYRWAGQSTQAGALAGTVLAFVLVNFSGLFAYGDPVSS